MPLLTEMPFLLDTIRNLILFFVTDSPEACYSLCKLDQLIAEITSQPQEHPVIDLFILMFEQWADGKHVGANLWSYMPVTNIITQACKCISADKPNVDQLIRLVAAALSTSPPQSQASKVN
jgi:hypothetical protein